MKQTAVQWYAQQQESLSGILSLGGITAVEYYEKLNNLVKEAMKLEKDQRIDFAKLHVEIALKNAADEAKVGNISSNNSEDWIDKDSIINSYKLSDIK